MPIGYSPDALVYDADSNSWSLRPDYDPLLHRVNIDITDDDAFLDGDSGADEVGSDTNQTAVVSDMNGDPIASGQIYDEEFIAIWDGENPHVYLEAVEIGGVPVGYIVNAPLEPGVVYTQSTRNDVDDSTAPSYSQFADVPCYAPGTLIDTPDGPRAIEGLKVGDMVITFDHGPQPIRWIRSSRHSLDSLEPHAKPVLISAGALGPGLPTKDLIVSPQHRIVVGGGQLKKWFTFQALAPAKSLTDVPGIRHLTGKRDVIWIHFACDRHEVVTANGCLSEALLLGPMVLNGLTAEERAALLEVFGKAHPSDAPLNGSPARECLKVGVVKRHIQNRRMEHKRIRAKEIQKWDDDLANETRQVGQPKERSAVARSR